MAAVAGVLLCLVCLGLNTAGSAVLRWAKASALGAGAMAFCGGAAFAAVKEGGRRCGITCTCECGKESSPA